MLFQHSVPTKMGDPRFPFFWYLAYVDLALPEDRGFTPGFEKRYTFIFRYFFIKYLFV